MNKKKKLENKSSSSLSGLHTKRQRKKADLWQTYGWNELKSNDVGHRGRSRLVLVIGTVAVVVWIMVMMIVVGLNWWRGHIH